MKTTVILGLMILICSCQTAALDAVQSGADTVKVDTVKKVLKTDTMIGDAPKIMKAEQANVVNIKP